MSAGDPLMVMELWLIVAGIYIWEFLSTLDFEWSFIRRHRRFRWTILIYSALRLSGLAVIILTLVNVYGTSPINCQAWVTSGWAFSALGGYGLSSVLIMLRIFAIWDGSKIIMAISASIWVINLVFQLAGIVKIRAAWVPAASSCAITNVEVCRGFYVTLLVTDIILLSIMLAGLLRFHRSVSGFSYISQLYWKQGVIYFAIATAAELPQALLLFLNLNDSLNLLLLLPSMVVIIITVTRTYRSLIHSLSNSDIILGEQGSSIPQKSQRLVSRARDSSFIQVPPKLLGPLEVTVHSAHHGEYLVSQAFHRDSDVDVEEVARIIQKKMSGSEGDAANKPVVTSAQCSIHHQVLDSSHH